MTKSCGYNKVNNGYHMHTNRKIQSKIRGNKQSGRRLSLKQGTGNRGTGNGERGTGNGERGIGERGIGESGNRRIVESGNRRIVESENRGTGNGNGEFT